MATVYAPPEELATRLPQFNDYRLNGGFRLDLEAYRAAEEAWVEDLRAWVKANTSSKSELVGEVIRFGYADGYASYMVDNTKPLTLIHLPLGDAYDLPDYQLRGLRVSDVKGLVERERALAELFGGGR